MRDTHSEITDRIIASLEAGVRPWFQPWVGKPAGFVRPLRHNGVPYQGVNVLMLWMTQMERGFASQYWMTFNQAKEFGAHVRKGEKGTTIIFWTKATKTNEETDEEYSFSMPKSYSVFNADQIDGLPEKYLGKPEIPEIFSKTARIPAVDAFFADLNMDLRHGGARAFYNIQNDYVQIPKFEKFKEAAGYYCTLAHESAHWTKHSTRLDRDLGRKRWGDEGYAMEELVAELSSAFLAADLGISAAPREDHASYLASWLKVLKNDKRAIFSMASMAEKAVGYLHSLQPEAMEIAA